MPSAYARIPTPDGSRLIKRLLTHWAHQFEVVLEPDHGEVPFDADTHATFDAAPAELRVRLDAAGAERLETITRVVADHLQRMARGATLQIEWTGADD